MMQNFQELSQDAVLLQQVGHGCPVSFKTLYEKHWAAVYAAAYKRLKDAEQSKDITQEIFTHLWLKRATLNIDNLPAYLHVAVRNRVLKLVSRQKRNTPFFSFLENLPALYLQADANLLAKEFFRAYEALVVTLPPKQQLIFRLRFQEGLSTHAIAQELGLSQKTVQNQLGKAIASLRLVPLWVLLLLLALAR